MSERFMKTTNNLLLQTRQSQKSYRDSLRRNMKSLGSLCPLEMNTSATAEVRAHEFFCAQDGDKSSASFDNFV